MKIETFHTLQSVITTGSMAAAAQQLHLSPGAVSMQIKQLEAFMGMTLFDRSGAAVSAKPLAYEVSDMSQQFLQQLNGLRQRSSLVVQGSMRLGVLDSLMPLLLPPSLVYAKQRYPHLTLQVVHGRSKFLLQQVRAGEVDLAVLAQPAADAVTRGLHWQTLMTIPFMLLAPPDSQGDVAQCLKHYPWIAYDRHTTSGAMAAQYVSQTYGDQPVAMEFDNISAIVSMVSLGLGVAVLQIADPRLLKMHALRMLALPNSAPVMHYALLSRQEMVHQRRIQAVQEALLHAASHVGEVPQTQVARLEST